MCGELTLSIPTRDSASRELPNARSGSNEFRTWFGFASIRTVPGGEDALSTCAETDAPCRRSTQTTIAVAAARLLLLSFLRYLQRSRKTMVPTQIEAVRYPAITSLG